jgi:hypothetical protein
MAKLPREIKCSGKGCPCKDHCDRWKNQPREMMMRKSFVSLPYNEETGVCTEILIAGHHFSK